MKTADDYFYQAYKQYKAWCKENGYSHKEMSGKFAELAGIAMREYAREVTLNSLEIAACAATEYFDWEQMDDTKEEYVDMVKKTSIHTP
ncbi:hypothetical protein [Pedobacter sp.]|uniref:hypothetical protein n=1 Tax=Pedobacter sp. TaxID=1411316 RepID=UPI003C64D52D